MPRLPNSFTNAPHLPTTPGHPDIKHLVRTQGFSALIGIAVMLVAFSILDFDGWWTAQTINNVLR